MARSGSAGTPPVVAALWGGAALSVVGLALHNIFEFGVGGMLALASGTLPVALVEFGIVALWWRFRRPRPGAEAALALIALVHLVVGAILTALPLSVLPFAPEQSLGHYGSHVVYGVAQLPLLWLLAWRWRRRRG